ncbi:SCO2524 family protein [Nocardia sp. NPDC058658]|uniref:SCO2524 family protein n=1 Tax=Nocardia sp. NPDC058658 TaxID=3346580 RepID=UPI00365657AF
MRIQPRQQILDIWSALVSACYRDGKWDWTGGVLGANSISDSEQLLCLLYPATEIESFALDRPDTMADDVRETLYELGGPFMIGLNVFKLLEEFLARNTQNGIPRFDAGSYLQSTTEDEPTVAQRSIAVVDSYSMSVTLCVAGMGFARVFCQDHNFQGQPDAEERSKKLMAGLSDRLTAALIALVRSFVVNTAAPRSPAGRAMMSMFNQGDQPERVVLEAIHRSLERVRARLRTDVTLGQADENNNLHNDTLLFECGWSWGIHENAAEVDFVSKDVEQPIGIADPRPYLYFTVVALDGINDVLSQRTRELNLLNDEQYRLAEALRLRWDLTQRYWATVARFGSGRWPLEDIPWKTSDGEESDYFSLIVSAVLIQELVARTASDDDLTRAVGIFDELSRRGRITRRPTRDDPAIALHNPGVRMALRGTEKINGGGPRLSWIVSDFATVLLKRTLQAARLSSNIAARDQLMELAKEVMDHLDQRAIAEGPAARLWDNPGALFGGAQQSQPSWYLTERVIECLVAAERTYREAPLRSPAMVNRAVELLNEAEHLLNQEMLNTSTVTDSSRRPTKTSDDRRVLRKVEQRLVRARELVNIQPGTSFTLASTALTELDALAVARNLAMKGMSG